MHIHEGRLVGRFFPILILIFLCCADSSWADEKPVWLRLSLVAKQSMVLGYIHGYQAGEMFSCNHWTVVNKPSRDRQPEQDRMIGRCYGYYEELKKTRYRDTQDILDRMVSWVDELYSDSSNWTTNISRALAEAYISNRCRDRNATQN